MTDDPESKRRKDQRFAIAAPAPGTFRVMTYNVHSCIGTDGELSIERIADVIEGCAADIVCLQELDVGRTRTRGVDQARLIAERLRMGHVFHPARSAADEHYGDAVLSRHPLTLVRAGALPEVPRKPHFERRGALWVSVAIEGAEVQVFNTHLGLLAEERKVQIEAMCGKEWLSHPNCAGPVVFCGDLNAVRGSRVYRKVKLRLRDAQCSIAWHWPRPTFPSRFPVIRIDHVFVNRRLEVEKVVVPREQFVRQASDHLPLVVDLRVR